jgi:hypothetical protein
MNTDGNPVRGCRRPTVKATFFSSHPRNTDAAASFIVSPTDTVGVLMDIKQVFTEVYQSHCFTVIFEHPDRLNFPDGFVFGPRGDI